MWFPFRMNGRDLEWTLECTTRRRILLVRSCCGDFRIQSTILDGVLVEIERVLWDALVAPPLVLGTEFPLGCYVHDVPFEMTGTYRFAKYGVIHTEFVRSLVERWSNRRYRRRAALP